MLDERKKKNGWRMQLKSSREHQISKKTHHPITFPGVGWSAHRVQNGKPDDPSTQTLSRYTGLLTGRNEGTGVGGGGGRRRSTLMT